MTPPAAGPVAVTDRGTTRIISMQAGHKPNTLSSGVVDELVQATSPEALATTRILVLRSQGKAFCGGFDLLEAGDQPSTTRRFLAIQTLLDQVRSAPAASVALVDGPAVGAGADLALSCDFRIASARSSFRFPGARFGVVLGTDHLVRTVGHTAATDILLRNRRVDAMAALRVGLVSEVRAVEEFSDFVDALEADLADLPDDVLRRLLDVLRSDDRAPHLQRLESSLRHPHLDARLQAFAERAVRRAGSAR